ncbi:MAG: AAA family ATPase [Pseudomonadota bacterium]
MSALPASTADLAQTARRQAGPVLAIASGKGGVGKTVVAIGLARAFARAGERTLLVDADLGMANVDVQMGLNPRGDLGDVVSARLSVAEAVAPALGGSEARGGFDVISGRSGSGALAGLELSSVNRLAAGLSAAALSYERTLLDLAAGADRATVRLAAAADDVLVVINDEPTSLTDAYAFIKTLRLRDEGAAPFIAVNAAPDTASGKQAYETLAKTCESFLGFRPPLAGLIERDSHVGEAIRAQTPVSVRSPASKAAKGVDALAKTLSEGVPVSQADAIASGGSTV